MYMYMYVCKYSVTPLTISEYTAKMFLDQKFAGDIRKVEIEVIGDNDRTGKHIVDPKNCNNMFNIAGQVSRMDTFRNASCENTCFGEAGTKYSTVNTKVLYRAQNELNYLIRNKNEK